MEELNSNQLKFNKILNTFLCSKETDFDLIINFYKGLEEKKSKLNPQTKPRCVNVRNGFNYFDFKKYSKKYSLIYFLQKQIKKRLILYVDYFFVHGSFATKDPLENWSDLDTLIILNDITFKNIDNLKYVQKWIRKLSLLCYKIDPLAHHRFFVMTKFDLNYYPQSFFPIILYDYIVALHANKNKINLEIRDDQSEKSIILVNFIKYFENKIKNNSYSNNLYDWKLDISHILLLPTLLLQKKNIHVYKKESFERCNKEFLNSDFNIVDVASQIRNCWQSHNVLKYYPNFLFIILPYLWNKFIIDRYRHILMRTAPQQKREEIKLITNQAFEFFRNICRTI